MEEPNTWPSQYNTSMNAYARRIGVSPSTVSTVWRRSQNMGINLAAVPACASLCKDEQEAHWQSLAKLITGSSFARFRPKCQKLSPWCWHEGSTSQRVNWYSPDNRSTELFIDDVARHITFATTSIHICHVYFVYNYSLSLLVLNSKPI